MKAFLAIASIIALCGALPVQNSIYQDESGQLYVLQPLRRHIRASEPKPRPETKVGVWGPGLEAGVKHSGVIIDNDSHRLDGELKVSKHFVPKSPVAAQGTLNYLHKDTGSGLTATAIRPQTGGTVVGLGGKYNLYQEGNFGVDLTGAYERQFGGPMGTQHPDWNTMLQAHYDF